jgi:hypothetical protein
MATQKDRKKAKNSASSKTKIPVMGKDRTPKRIAKLNSNAKIRKTNRKTV